MRAGIKPATDCMMMLTFSLVGVSVNTFAAERFTSCRHIIAGQFIRPNKKTSSWLINRRESHRTIVLKISSMTGQIICTKHCVLF